MKFTEPNSETNSDCEPTKCVQIGDDIVFRAILMGKYQPA